MAKQTAFITENIAVNQMNAGNQCLTYKNVIELYTEVMQYTNLPPLQS